MGCVFTCSLLVQMRVPLLSAVEVGNHYIAQLILNEIGGQEKVLVSATEAGMEDLANHLCQLDEMVRDFSK